MSCINRLSNELRSRGYRITPQRLAVLQALHKGGHTTPAQVFERIKQVIPAMTETTVYRTLEFLTENGVLLSTNSSNGHITYELAQSDHHHMVCQVCGLEVDLNHNRVQPFYDQIEKETGFHLNGGHLTLMGKCSQCKENSNH
jgi:Fur family ferric uptake transcriptional regulator